MDRLFDWLRTRPGPVWFYYLALWLLLFLLFSALTWLDGLQPVFLPFLVAVDEATYIVYYLALIHFLDGTAERALHQFHPLLRATDSEFANLRYELTTMPARGMWIAAVIGLLVTLISLPFAPPDAPLAEAIRQPSTQFAFLIGNAILAILIYHTIRQLRLVSRIHTLVPRLNLYQRGPVYAFSRLTARTAFGLVLGLTLGLSPRLPFFLAIESMIVLWTPMLLLSMVLFVLPLIGVHQLLDREKTRLQNEVEERIETVLLQVHGKQDVQEMSNLADLKTLLDTLLVERELVAKLPTWPWQPGTLAGLSSAVFLPLAIWLLQELFSTWLTSP